MQQGRLGHLLQRSPELGFPFNVYWSSIGQLTITIAGGQYVDSV
jgi:hypothetical protein